MQRSPWRLGSLVYRCTDLSHVACGIMNALQPNTMHSSHIACAWGVWRPEQQCLASFASFSRSWQRPVPRLQRPAPRASRFRGAEAARIEPAPVQRPTFVRHERQQPARARGTPCLAGSSAQAAQRPAPWMPYARKRKAQKIEHRPMKASMVARQQRLQLARLRASTSDTAVLANEESAVKEEFLWDERAVSITSALHLVFLGTAADPCDSNRAASCLAFRKPKAVWLFDCGEDTQRQVQQQPLIRNGKIDRIFLTSGGAHNNLFGLPGMLCIISAARVVGNDAADWPVHIYGPPGLAEYLAAMLDLSDTYMGLPVFVHELVSHAVPPKALQEPELLDRRACLYRILVPPDALNPQGYYDGEIEAFLERARERKSQTVDERSTSRPIPLPPPGDPSRVLEPDETLTWTIKCDEEFVVTAIGLDRAPPSWGYVIQEAARVGTLDVNATVRLGVPAKLRADLKLGIPVRNRDGETVLPEQVVGPDKPGRKVAIFGDTPNTAAAVSFAQGADVIVHSATCLEDGEQQGRVSIAVQAGAFAQQCRAGHLVLNYANAASASEATEGSAAKQEALRVRNTRGGYVASCRPNNPRVIREATEGASTDLLDTAKAAFGKQSVLLAHDMQLLSIDRRV